MARIDRQSAFSGTKEVADSLRFDETRLAAYLAAKVEGFCGPLAVRQFKGGQSNPTYFLQTPQRSFVLRRKPPGKLLPSAHAVDREFRVMAALHGQDFPVPEPVVYCDDPDIAGTAFFVMGFVEGRIFWEPDLPASNPAERAAIYDAANATIARLHRYDPAAIGLADFGRGENYVARTGLDPRPHLPAYLAYNFFRIAAIYQGIVGRVRDGTATSEYAPAKALMVRPLAATAWSFAREAGQ